MALTFFNLKCKDKLHHRSPETTEDIKLSSMMNELCQSIDVQKCCIQYKNDAQT